MRKYENILDQQAAKKSASFMSSMPSVTQGVEELAKSLLTNRQPELTPENRSDRKLKEREESYNEQSDPAEQSKDDIQGISQAEP